MDRIPFTANEQTNGQVDPALVLLSYETYRPKLDALQKDWDKEQKETDRRRRIRKIDVDVESLRQQKKLKPDETLIGVRVIDENIRKEQPIFVNYLTQSDRLAVFDCQSTPDLPTKPLEIAFTKGMSYSGMLKNLFKTIDGAQTHGWDAVEVTYDESKPLHCGIEHIGHGDLLFSWQAKDAQADEVIMRRFKVTDSQLRSWVRKHGFDAQQVEMLLKQDDKNKIPDPKDIYKAWIKVEDVIYVAWVSIEGNKCSNWLKAPTKLDLGRRKKEKRIQNQEVILEGISLMAPTQVEVEVPEDETMFPVFLYIYMESEEQCITEQKGRVFFDRPWQDAQIALRSLVINGAVRASNVYGSPKNQSATGGRITKLDLTLEHGCFYSEPMEFWRTDYPDPAILRAADALDTRKAAETGQTAAAVINRDDSRKTAKELQSAENEQAKLSLTPLMLFSSFMRDVLSFAWYIVQSQAKQNKITLMSIQTVDAMGMPTVINNPMYIDQRYDIKPAGDPDVVRKEETITRMVNMLPIIQNTPAWVPFLKDLINYVLPERAEIYNAAIDSGEQNKDQTILALTEMLKTAVTDEQGNIEPEFQQHSQMLQQMFSQLPQNKEGMMNESTNINQ